jgi:hypothetical protein
LSRLPGAVCRRSADSDVRPDAPGRRPSDMIFPKDVRCDNPACNTTTTRPNYTCVRVFKHLGNEYCYPTCRSLSELAVDATRVLCGAGRLPARPVRPIDLRSRLVRVKRALTGGLGKSDLPCPCWLPLGPPRRCGSGRRRVAGRGRNGAYGTSGADAMERTGCRALTLWATAGRRARTGRTDIHSFIHSLHMPITTVLC